MNESHVCSERIFHELIFATENLGLLGVPFIILICLFVVVSLIAIFGNGVVIFTILKTPNLQKPSYLLITSMASTDLLMALTLYPFSIVMSAWILQKDVDFACRLYILYIFIGVFFISQSFVMSLLISVDRYLAIALKHRYRLTVTKNRILWCIFLTWIIVFLWTLSMRYIVAMLLHWRLISGVTGLLILSITSGFYTKSFLSLHRHSSQVHNQQSNTSQQPNFDASKYRKSLNTMVMILVWLLVCSSVMVVAPSAVANYEPNEFSKIIYFTSIVVFSINSCTTPVIYIVRFTDIRNACRETVRGLIGH